MKTLSKLPALLLLLALLLSALVPLVSAADDGAVLSYGILVLAARTDMAVSARVGNDAVFSADLFARAMNLSSVSSVTIRSLPASEDGVLLLGSTRVASGQTVSAANLSYLTLSPAREEVYSTSFLFSVNGNPAETCCRVSFLSERNNVPTVSMASGLSLNMATHRDYPAYGTLSAYDPDGDALVYEIVSYPQNGSIRLVDRAAGTYIYTPVSGYSGSDSFRYVARDPYGNYSAAATVRLRVSVPETAVIYVDMEGSVAANAALTLTEKGIMSGDKIGNADYFHPERSVTNVEFLVSLMHAAGITEVPDCAQTVFDDDAEIPDGMRGYVDAAYRAGYISGNLSDGILRFRPNAEITRAEAAVMLASVIGTPEAAVTPVFADAGEIPSWALSAVSSLHAAGIFLYPDGVVSPGSPVTRAEAAIMLERAMEAEK